MWSGDRCGGREPFSIAVTIVLELAGCPLRVREVHAAVEELYGERVRFRR